MNPMPMRQIDGQFLETPFFGVRPMTWHPRNDGHLGNERRIRRLMRPMGLMPIYQKPNAAGPAKGHETYPYLLIELRVTRPNQVRARDITDIPVRRGFLYSMAIIDRCIRKVVSRRISNALGVDFCVEALNEAMARYGMPVIMNTDQGSQFISFAWTHRLRQSGVHISMDGEGRFSDKNFAQRLWRSLKYEWVYLYAWDTGTEARAGIARWGEFYNHKRPHSAHGGQPPGVVCS